MASPDGAIALVTAVVKDLEDPEGLGRVRVEYPHLNNEVSDPCSLVTPMAGPERGIFFKPEPGDVVLVGFEFNDRRRAFILGSIWSTVDKPPPRASEEPKKNNLRFIHTRSGHVLRFDDTPDKEKIEIVDQSGELTIVLDSAAKKIQVINTSGDVEISATKGTVKIDAQQIEIGATTTMSLTAGNALTIKGATVGINDP